MLQRSSLVKCRWYLGRGGQHVPIGVSPRRVGVGTHIPNGLLVRQFSVRSVQDAWTKYSHRLGNYTASHWRRTLTTQPPQSDKQGLIRRFWTQYNMWLDKQPLATKMATSTVLAMAGDLICQLAFEDKVFSFRRFLEVGSLGAFMIGPALHYWYTFLASFIPGTNWSSVFKRLAMDQLLFAPTFVASVFVYMATIQGKANEAVERVQLYWPQAIFANWKLWVPAQIINFSLVPVKFQVLFANFVSLIWNAYLSWATNRNIGDTAKEFEEMTEQQEQEENGQKPE